MRLTGYEDLRVQRTISNIYAAFESLICEIDYEKIRVTELAKRAMINKKTFYRYYPTLDDLLAEMQETYAEAYIERIKDYRLPEDLSKMQRAFFEFSAQQGQAYDKITISHSSYSDIRQDMVDMVMAATWSKSPKIDRLNDFQRVSLLNFVQNTGLALYRQWVEEGKTTPLEDVINTAILLTNSGVTALLEQK
ncbi:TetR/AcrR family transcriptional regulator [Streptococcus chenjunshii]|uniref:TetR/AcrR family transcriptional regulator n=1 Tax=Streptococcus chenjunshii TaxID=2173853 RepID=A0A372KRE7_9STRE|nr:TetR/AcrR family transcriptional regulator [Streptococcus chenjunshii]AXQ78513.1 TetR/AcrR family transcriptional regulator [Streptococcus chenjunshii]RFU52026.1 TetR/AcrR family transcriptional regulator [Streptococcus chenjunshii]RFU54218.1 TetR/AcrR family transcriptional regulator [Streptococcus chenjunshii]